jgi:transcriptional regulator
MADDFKFGTPFTPDMISKFNASIQSQKMFAESIAAEQDRRMRQAQEVGEQAYQNRKRMQEAMERTAHNTDVTNKRLEKMIDQQSSYIELLEKANETLQKQLETGQKQLEILRNIFASGEDGVLVEKELMNLIKKEIDETHPLWKYVTDKGGDIAVAGATAGIPVLYGAFKEYLLSKGIMLS